MIFHGFQDAFFSGEGNCLKLGNSDDGVTLNILRNHCIAHFKRVNFTAKNISGKLL